MSIKPAIISFEQMYSDDSGVEFGVSYYAGETDYKGGTGVVIFNSIGDVHFPIKKIDWLIACLNKIKHEINQ